MKSLIFEYLALVLVLAGIGIPIAAEDLDAALAAQKKKTQRRVYSDTAVVEDRNLSVPKTETEEDRQLDKKLREMEEKANAPISLSNMTPPHRMAPAPVRSVEDKNWLTTAVMNDTPSVSQAESKDNDWIVWEADRKKAKTAAAEEDALVQRLLREKTQLQPQNTTPELERLKKYQLDPKTFNAGRDPTPAGPSSYMLPQSGTPDPMKSIRPAPRKESLLTPPLFSPQAVKTPQPTVQAPLQSYRSPLNNPEIVSPSRRVLPSLSSGLTEPETPLTPLQMIKKSSPINRQDPFAEDHMPKLKNSIWD
jgi:hypothetical protein